MEHSSEPGLAALSRYFVGDTTMGETLQRVVGLGLAAVPAARYAGISTTLDARLDTWVASHPDVVEIDRMQYETGDGPCVEAFRTGEVVHLRSTASGPYEQFREAARAHGVTSVLAVPMVAGDQVAGALNFYATADGEFRTGDTDAGLTFATQAAFLLVNAQAYWDARTLGETLTEAMRSRAQIEQAKGIIMATTGLSADEAFARLVEQSQHENVKLRVLAAELVQRTLRARGGS